MTALEHEPTNGRYTEGCRCPGCTEAHRVYAAARRAVRYAMDPKPAHMVHGTKTAYDSWGCRCQECRTANAEYQRRLRLFNNLFPNERRPRR